MSVHPALSVTSRMKRAIRSRSRGARASSGSVIPVPSDSVCIAFVWGRVNNFPCFNVPIPFYPSLDDRPLLLLQRTHDLLVQMQMGLDEFGWRQCHPLIERDIGKVVALEHLQEAQRGVARILDVVAHRKGHIAYIARLVVEGAGRATRGKHGHAPAALNVILPLV